MGKVQKKLTEIFTNPYMPFFVLGIITLVFHLVLIDTKLYDDATIASILDNTSMLPYLVNRYKTWSSRMIMEVLIYYVGTRPMLWRIMDPAMTVILGLMISKLFVGGNELNKNILICSLIGMYPLLDMTSAGWMATSMSYLWPLAFGFIAMFPVKKTVCSQKIRWYDWIISILSMCVAATTEQSCAIQFGIYTVMIIYLIIKKNFKNKFLLLLQWIISVAGLMMVFLCPGNKARSQVELRWFPKYATYSPLHKLELGFSSTLAKFILEANMIFLAFAVLLAVVIFIKKKGTFVKLLACVPVLGTLVFGFSRNILSFFAPNLEYILTQMTLYSQTGTYDLQYGNKVYEGIVLLDCYMAVACLCILICLYFAFDKKEHSYLAIFAVLLGFASRMAISLSPTLYASGVRTYIYFYFAFACVAVMLYREFSQTADKAIKKKAYVPGLAFVIALALISFMNTALSVSIYPDNSVI